MAAQPQDYLAVLKAAYDYDPQPDADDEIAVKENQLLYLLERVDDEYVPRITPHLSAMPPSDTNPLPAGGRSRSRVKPKRKMASPVWCPQHMLSR